MVLLNHYKLIAKWATHLLDKLIIGIVSDLAKGLAKFPTDLHEKDFLNHLQNVLRLSSVISSSTEKV